jgi:hypothetical protein
MTEYDPKEREALEAAIVERAAMIERLKRRKLPVTTCDHLRDVSPGKQATPNPSSPKARDSP